MGCVYSGPGRTAWRRTVHGERRDSDSGNHNAVASPSSNRTFRVINVDDQGTEINSGDIEVTSSDLLLHQRGKSSVCWPLRSLRRYGFDSELFSFECGRRCVTGAGIYAFRCTQAEQLFNVLQEAIQSCSSTNFPPVTSNGFVSTSSLIGNQNGAGGGSPAGSPPHSGLATGLPGPDTGPRRSSRVSSPPPTSPLYVNDVPVHQYMNSPFYVNTTTIGTSTMLPSGTAVTSHSLPTTGVTDINTNYAKLDDLFRYYENIKTPLVPSTSQTTQLANSSRKLSTTMTTTSSVAVVTNNCSTAAASLPATGANLDNANQSTTYSEEVGYAAINQNVTFTAATRSVPSSPTINLEFKLPEKGRREGPCVPPKVLTLLGPPTGNEPMNYITLDLDSTSSTSGGGVHIVTTAPATPVTKTPKYGENSWTPPGTPTSLTSIPGQAQSAPVVQQSYATIDFDKTAALNSAVSRRKCN